MILLECSTLNMSIKLDVIYDLISGEDLAYLKLKYETCHYRLENHPELGLVIDYDTPSEWPALFYMEMNDDDIRYGVFTSKKNINLAFIEYNKRRG